MKNILLISFSSLLITLFCGSINDWSDKYYKADDDIKRLDALKFIHCQPVVDQFKGDSLDIQKLDKLLVDALKEKENIKGPDKYVINLVFKNYVRFDLEDYDGLEISKILAAESGMTTKALRRVIRAIPKSANIRMDKNLGNSHEAYAQQIAEEINAIYQ